MICVFIGKQPAVRNTAGYKAKEMNTGNVVSQAYESYKAGDFSKAKSLYGEAARIYGEKFFALNLELCQAEINNKLESDFVIPYVGVDGLIEVLLGIDDGWVDGKISQIKSSLESKEMGAGSYSQAVLRLIFWVEIKNKNKISAGKIVQAMDFESPGVDVFVLEILEASAYFKSIGESPDALKVVLGLYELNKTERTLRALYWAGFNSGKNEVAKFALTKIVEIGNERSSTDQWLKLAHERLNNGSSLLNEVKRRLSERKVAPVYQPVSRRIAYFLHNSLPYSSGGYATRAQGIAAGLMKAGFDVLCTSRPGFPLDIAGDHVGRDLTPGDIVDGVKYLRIFEPLRKNINGNVYMLAAADEIVQYLKKHRVEAVLAASNHLTAIPAAIAAREVGIPFFYEVRGFWEITRISREPAYKSTPQYAGQVENERLAAVNADAVFTLTTPMKEELVKRGVNEQSITILPNSCDPTKFSPRGRDRALAESLGIPSKVPVIGYIGSFVQYEGLENLAQACAELIKKNIDFRLLLVGNENASGSERGPITEEILRVASEEGLADKLIMPGRIPHDQVESFYSLIDIAPFPRKPQPVTEMVSPMKPLEALAMEKAVVVSSVRALTEMIIENETGLVFEKGNIKDLSEKLEILIKDEKLRCRLGKNGRSWVENERTWNRTSEKARDVINKFLL